MKPARQLICAVSGEFSREKISAEEAKEIQLTFKGEMLTIKIGKETLQSTYHRSFGPTF